MFGMSLEMQAIGSTHVERRPLCKGRHRIENRFARLQDWRRVATRCEGCPNVLPNACAFAAVVNYRR